MDKGQYDDLMKMIMQIWWLLVFTGLLVLIAVKAVF